MLNRFFVHLKTYRFIYLFNLGILVGGFIFGSFLYKHLDTAKLASLNDFMSFVLSIDYIKDPAMIQANLLSNLFLMSIVFVLGLSLLGIPLLALILFSKGLQIGFSFMQVYALKGIVGILLSLIPFVFLELVSYLLICAVAYEISLSLWLTCFIKKQTLSLKSVLNHFLNYILLTLILILISTLFKIYILPLFYA